MKALHWDGGALRLARGYPEPAPRAGYARLRVRLAGICSTDLQILAGYMGFTGVPGHELVGEVIDHEGGEPGLVGRRVVAEINFACGACASCAAGLGRHCPTRQVMGILGADGAFAEVISAPLANLHRVPDGMPDEVAVFAEPLAAAFELVEQVPGVAEAEAVVLGDGKLGLLCAQALAVAGARVTVVGRHEAKLACLAGRGIRTVKSDAFRPDARADLVVEATGSEEGLALAMAAVRPRGTLVLKTTVAAEHRVSLAPLVINEVTVIGSRCGPFAPALAALGGGEVVTAPLVSDVLALEDGLEAFARARRPGVLKVLLRASE